MDKKKKIPQKTPHSKLIQSYERNDRIAEKKERQLCVEGSTDSNSSEEEVETIAPI